MATKAGRITSYGRTGRKFTEAFLESGEKIELSAEMLDLVRTHDRDDFLVFVERRGLLFSFVQWLGTPADAVGAIDSGVLRPSEVPAGVYTIGMASRHPTGPEMLASLERSRSGMRAALELRAALPITSPTTADGFDRLIKAVLLLNESQLAEIAARADAPVEVLDPDEWFDAYSTLSNQALAVGGIVRGARWPNPTDEAGYFKFRSEMTRDARATESAAAGLAERSITDRQREILYYPLAASIPLDRIQRDAQ